LISLPCILVNTKYLSFAILKNIFFIYVHYAAFKVQEASPLTTGYCRFLKSSSLLVDPLSTLFLPRCRGDVSTRLLSSLTGSFSLERR